MILIHNNNISEIPLSSYSLYSKVIIVAARERNDMKFKKKIAFYNVSAFVQIEVAYSIFFLYLSTLRESQ